MPKKSVLREAVGRPCPYCERPMRYPPEGTVRDKNHSPSRDHVYPKSRLTDARLRYVILIVCFRCNQDKKNHTLDEWLLVLQRRNDPRSKIVGGLIGKMKLPVVHFQGAAKPSTKAERVLRDHLEILRAQARQRLRKSKVYYK